ncbi:MAG: sulfatase, partial [Verrucomicrobiota bacterium]|nr:sulfatase [Verrucomicrobiota bacterium]
MRILVLILIWLAAVSVVAESKIKNVLFLISDDLKASVLGAYGDPICETPNIDRLAHEGMVFDRTYCQGTSCAPSRRSFMHSRYEGETEINMGKHFIDNGYFSARVGKIYHMKVPGDIIAGTDGLDIESTWLESYNSPGLEAHTVGDYACLNLNIFTSDLGGRYSTAMPHRWFVTVSYEGDGSDQPDYKTASQMIELIRQRKNEPFYLAAGFVRPHYPMVAPQRYFDKYPIGDIELPYVPEDDHDDIPPMGFPNVVSTKDPIGKYPDNQKRMWAGYYATVTYMDEQVGRIVDELEAQGLRDETVIVFISDHGYHLGEHHFWQKSNLHEEALRVPLIISAPGFRGGRSAAMVELMDIFPTVAELTGLSIPDSVQGESLVPILNDPNQRVREAALSIDGSGYALRTERWAYIRYNDETEELYDMMSDPSQITNLAFNP